MCNFGEMLAASTCESLVIFNSFFLIFLQILISFVAMILMENFHLETVRALSQLRFTNCIYVCKYYIYMCGWKYYKCVCMCVVCVCVCVCMSACVRAYMRARPSKSRSWSTISAMKPFDGKCQNLLKSSIIFVLALTVSMILKYFIFYLKEVIQNLRVVNLSRPAFVWSISEWYMHTFYLLSVLTIAKF